MIRWDERYEVGVEDIDKQHKMLFEFFNDFELAIKEGRGVLFVEMYFSILENYAAAHFTFEENCMDKYQCPVAGENKKFHQSFISKVQELKDAYKQNQFNEQTVANLHHYLENWITHHIVNVDAHLKQCIKNQIS